MYYTLMNKDRGILRFTTSRTEYGGVRVSESKVLQPDLLPPEYNGDIVRFVEKRKAPKHRKYVQSILKQLGAEDLEGFIKVSNGASLTDTFWVRNDEEPKTWDQVSLYRNDFDENIARIAFEGGSASLSSTTPELSVDGNYAKCWIKENGELYLLKRGSETFGREVFAEYYASQLAEIFCPKAVKYDLVCHHGHLATKCNIFTSEDIGFSQMMYHVENPYSVVPQEVLSVMDQYGDGDNFRRMMILDALILNIDRHLGNFGLLVDNNSLKAVGMAPVFDNNRSMLFNLNDVQFMAEDMDGLMDLYPRLVGEFNLIANDMLTDSIKGDLLNLRDFRFHKSGLKDWPDERLEKYEHFISRQIDKILKRETLFVSRFD